MTIRREWAMPSANTFEIAPIRSLLARYVKRGDCIVDPFANRNRIGTITNDLDPSFDTTYHLDALEFLRLLPDESADLVLYDPPYSPRQVAECYKAFGMTVNMETTQGSYWSRQKREIARILKPRAFAISFGWNTNGIGKKNGMEIAEVLLVAHGGVHNDTICTVEQKAPTIFDFHDLQAASAATARGGLPATPGAGLSALADGFDRAGGHFHSRTVTE